VLKRHRRREFEEGWQEIRLTESLELFGQLCHLRLSNHLTVYADPLSELHQMGRGIEPHSIPCRPQHGGDNCRGRSLSIRPTDVERAVPGLRQAESHDQCRHRLKAQFDAMLLQTIQIGHGRGVGHDVQEGV
jgi:hypothetical protein